MIEKYKYTIECLKATLKKYKTNKCSESELKECIDRCQNAINGLQNKYDAAVNMAAIAELKHSAAMRIIESCMSNLKQSEIDRIELLHNDDFNLLQR